MEKFDMDDFLSAIHDFCDDIDTTWIAKSDLDPGPLKQIKARVQEFALKSRKDIISLYDFAKGKGRYAFVKAKPLMEIICRYEEYHDELNGFIKSVSSPDWKPREGEDISTYIKNATEVDTKFREQLFFAEEPERKVVPQAISDMDSIMCITTFIDKVGDNFISLSNIEDNHSEKMVWLIDLYKTSALLFLEQLLVEIVMFVKEMIAVRDGKRYPSDTNEGFKLI